MKTIVITGSTRGIGRGLATEFLKRGCNVVISGRTADTVERALAELRRDFPAGRIAGHLCDVTDISQVQSLWDAAVAAFGQVDI
ncbi:MAG TPA: SDR family NAD(P)-dependent oxidoreductase, partial [Anaerolineae bacterium]|nr:SDR family NAD(P)-dependent oxidoreductase [Anaerolineae bacterium]